MSRRLIMRLNKEDRRNTTIWDLIKECMTTTISTTVVLMMIIIIKTWGKIQGRRKLIVDYKTRIACMRHRILKGPIQGGETMSMMLEISKMNNYKRVKKTATIPRTKIGSSNKIVSTVENIFKEAQEIRRLYIIGTLRYLGPFAMISHRQGSWEVCLRGRWQILPLWIIK